ncbi:MAG: cysteine desulfurase family protein [Rhodosalinus sp.]
MSRLYLDWNATAPLRPEARAAAIGALDVLGNPSSVHAEGRAARALVERARAQVLEAIGGEGYDLVFTSGATEAAGLACAGRGLVGSGIEHDAVRAWVEEGLPVDAGGRVAVAEPAKTVLQLANSETGVVQDLPAGLAVSDMTQAFGKLPVRLSETGVEMALVSAHKLGGPKGIGALLLKQGRDVVPRIPGGGQEMGRRSGTENLPGIAGFGAAAEAARRDVDAGLWDETAEFRNILENALEALSDQIILVGKGARRLPNTLCLAAPGWKGETQVMAMDLAGYAVSAGSACSSGKLRASAVLQAMGFGEEVAAGALRVSLGPGIGRDDVLRFAEAWSGAWRRHRARAA